MKSRTEMYRRATSIHTGRAENAEPAQLPAAIRQRANAMNHDHVFSEPNLPAELRPTQTIAVKLSPDRIIRLPLCTPCFPSWKGRIPEFSFGRKPFLEYSGQPVFAELLILRLLESAGWSGRWVSSYGGIKFLTDMPANAPDVECIIAEQRAAPI
jgi:hypothetical protein